MYAGYISPIIDILEIRIYNFLFVSQNVGYQMKIGKKTLAIATLLAANLNALAGGSNLVLREVAGLPGECEVCDYNPETGFVKLHLDSTSTNLPFSSFPADFQKEIVGWATDEAFKSSSSLKVKIKRQSHRRKIDQTRFFTKYRGKEDKSSYIITLENRTPFQMENIRLKYVIFYEETVDMGGREPIEQHGCIREEQSIDIPPNKTIVVKTHEVVIMNVDETSDYPQPVSIGNGTTRNSSSTRYLDKLLGVHLSLGITATNGERLEREMKDGRIPREDQRHEYKIGSNPPKRSLLKIIH